MKVADLGAVEVKIHILRLSDPTMEQNVIEVIHWIDTTWLFSRYRVFQRFVNALCIPGTCLFLYFHICNIDNTKNISCGMCIACQYASSNRNCTLYV